MDSKTSNLLNEYFSWYEKKYTVKELQRASEIITPFVNHINDRIAIYVEYLPSGKIRISDDGVTIQELEMAGYKETPARKKMFNDIKKSFGISQYEDVLCVTADNSKEFPQKKHNMIQAILKVYDLLFVVSNNVKTLFTDDVYDFFYDNDFGGTEQPKLTGSSGILHHVNYSLGKTRNRPNTVFQFFGDPSFSNVAAQTYIKDDLEKQMGEMKYVIIADDRKRKIPSKSKVVAEDTGVELIPWSKREKILTYK